MINEFKLLKIKQRRDTGNSVVYEMPIGIYGHFHLKNKLCDYITSAGIMTDIGIAYDVNKELIINKDLLKF